MRLIASLLFMNVAVTVQATDLTPHFLVRKSEGVLVRRPYFADGDKKYGIKIDAETKLTAYQGGALFRFEHLPSAALQLRASTVPAATGFGPETRVVYEKAARSLLPSGATEVTLVASEADPYPINRWQSLGLTFSYRLANLVQRQSVVFLNLKPTEQIVVQTTATERNFEEVAARAFNIVRRWHEILPEEAAPFS